MHWRLILLLVLAISCQKERETLQMEKINFDLSQLNEDGLVGSKDGLRALDYEFCIPDIESFEKEVLSIDPSLKISKGSRGRIGCSQNEFLCIGSTHQDGYLKILEKLTTLHYIEKIDQCLYE
ncbi:MAG: hypothetical protein KTR26_08295 [Flammeovirgaceae bacterium]|nr:hypothetical protein [Flammeovirgaceae bacterium]